MRTLTMALCLMVGACGVNQKQLPTTIDLRGRELPCETIMSKLTAASVDHNKKHDIETLKTNGWVAACTVGSVFTFGAVGLGCLGKAMIFPSGDGGVGAAYNEWEHWHQVAGYKGCGGKPSPAVIPVKEELL